MFVCFLPSFFASLRCRSPGAFTNARFVLVTTVSDRKVSLLGKNTAHLERAGGSWNSGKAPGKGVFRPAANKRKVGPALFSSRAVRTQHGLAHGYQKHARNHIIRPFLVP